MRESKEREAPGIASSPPGRLCGSKQAGPVAAGSSPEEAGREAPAAAGKPLIERQTDEALMARLARGGHDAFEVLLSRYGDAVVTFCYAFLRNREGAEDLAQEAFLRVYRSAARYKPLAKFTTWLYRIAANLSNNELQKRKLRRAISLDEPARGGAADSDGSRIVERIAGKGALPLTEAEVREAHRLVEQAIERLPDDQRTTLVMVEYHNLSYREIAEILGVTVSAIKMRVKRARETLREMLRLMGEGPA